LTLKKNILNSIPIIDYREKTDKSRAAKRNFKWKEICYICSAYGDLICCDSCSNVAHLFCACIEVL